MALLSRHQQRERRAESDGEVSEEGERTRPQKGSEEINSREDADMHIPSPYPVEPLVSEEEQHAVHLSKHIFVKER